MSVQSAEKYWDQSLELVESCPVCGDLESSAKYVGLRDGLEGLPGEWNIWSCVSCGSLFLNPRPKINFINKAYRTYYTHGTAADTESQDSGSSFIWRLANGYLNTRFNLKRFPASDFGNSLIPLMPPLRQQLDFYMRHLPPNVGRLLDVGCGNGAFLARALRAGWDVFGLDPDPLAVKAAQSIGIPVERGTLETFSPALSCSFDYITASNVMEHVHAPRLFVQKIFDALGPGGAVWLATPNVSGFGHKWFQNSWRGLEPPRHMVLFARRSLENLLAESGFVDINFHRRGRGSHYILAASAQIAKQQGRRVLPLSSVVIDVLASVFASFGEELVVTAKRPLL